MITLQLLFVLAQLLFLLTYQIIYFFVKLYYSSLSRIHLMTCPRYIRILALGVVLDDELIKTLNVD